MKIVEYSKGSITEVENVFKVVESGAQGPQGEPGTIGTLDLLDPKVTPIDADLMLVGDSAASFANKKTTWANIKTALKAYFDTLYAGINHTIASHDTTATGANLTELTDASETILHSHAGGGGGGGSWTNVSSYTVTGAETDIDFTDLTDGPYMFVFESLSMSGQLHMLHSVDNGVSFSSTAAEYYYHQNRTAATSGNYSGQGNNGANAYYLLCHLTTGLSDRSIEGEIFVATKRLAKTLLIRSDLVVHSNSDTNQKLMARGPINVDALRFHSTIGTFLTGKIHLLKFDGRA